MQIKYNDRFLSFKPYPGKIERNLLFVGYNETKSVHEYVAEFLVILRDYFTSNIEISECIKWTIFHLMIILRSLY